jgi:hypothetical protein
MHSRHLYTPLHRKPYVLHVFSLKKNHSNGTHQPPCLPEVAEEEVSYEVDHISETSSEGCQRHYFVHWLGGGQTWESARLLRGCDDHIADFWESQGQKPPKEAFPLSTAELAEWLACKQASRGSDVTIHYLPSRSLSHVGFFILRTSAESRLNLSRKT